MSTWTDYEIPTTMITTSDGVARPVRGLSLDDLGRLVVDHIESLMDLTTLFIQTQQDVRAVTNMTDMLTKASRDFPELTSEVIALVTDEPKLRTMKLPAVLQITILQAAFKLTVEDAGGMGNLSAMLSDAAKAAIAKGGAASQRLTAILSPSSIGVAAKM